MRYLALILVAVSGPALAQSAETGRALAERWCAECHVTGTGQARAVDGVPSFEALARDPRLEEGTFWDRVSNPRHPAMPGFTLSREQLRSLWLFVQAQRG